jgi:hypothetical protein
MSLIWDILLVTRFARGSLSFNQAMRQNPSGKATPKSITYVPYRLTRVGFSPMASCLVLTRAETSTCLAYGNLTRRPSERYIHGRTFPGVLRH